MSKGVSELLKQVHLSPDQLIPVEKAADLDTEAAQVVAAIVNACDSALDEAIRSGVVLKSEEFGITDLPKYLVKKSERDSYRLSNGTTEVPHEVVCGVIRATVERTAEIRKTADEQKVAYAVVYSPVEKQGEDVHGDWMAGPEIQAMAWNFVAKAAGGDRVDTEHDYNPIEAEVVESFIVRKNDPDFPDDEGAWVVAVRFKDDATWQEVKNGTFTGLSMGGMGNYVTEVA